MLILEGAVDEACLKLVGINIMKIDRKSKWTGTIIGASFALGAVLGQAASADHHGGIMAALANPDRPEQDRARDANRKPVDVLLFAGVKPGMTVLDLNSGGGYYSEILSHVVGDEGKVYAHNGAVYWAFMQKTVPARFAERLPNIVPVNVESEEVDLPAGTVDVVMSVLAYHDYFMKHEARTEPEDMTAILGSIYKSLKPGGSFVVIDHEAPTGTGSEMGDKLHRINSEFVKKQVTEAGFTFAGESEILANSEDDPSQSPFRPDFRGKTDRFVMKFTK